MQKTTPFDSHLYVSHKREPFKKAYFPLEANPQVRIGTDRQADRRMEIDREIDRQIEVLR